jgi:Leucine-rich repeat (LRR) protein
MIYPAVTYGDNKDPISSPTKIAANTPYTFYATAEVGATDTIHIAGGAVLTDVGDLSKWSPYEVKVGLGTNLKTLILGNKSAGYENLKLDRLDLTNCQLLEVINVENCKALEELDVSGNGLIKEIYTFASNIKKVTVPNGGVLTKIEYGSKVTAINI